MRRSFCVYAARHSHMHIQTRIYIYLKKTLTAKVFPCSIILVVNPLSGVRVEVGLGGSIAQRIITDTDCQVNIKYLRWDQTLGIHQLTRGQLLKKKKKKKQFKRDIHALSFHNATEYTTTMTSVYLF